VTQQQFMVWNPYAFYMDAVGPTDLLLVDAQGQRTRQDGLLAGQSAAQLIGGELVNDPLLGAIWLNNSDWSCTSAASRLALGAECNP
jgi:hypothetical protein